MVPFAKAAGVMVTPPLSEHRWTTLAELRGFGEPAEKSTLLSPALAHPAPPRRLAVVLVRVGAGVPREQFAAPNPTKSTTLLRLVGHDPLRAVAEFTKAILAVVALIAMVPL